MENFKSMNCGLSATGPCDIIGIPRSRGVHQRSPDKNTTNSDIYGGLNEGRFLG